MAREIEGLGRKLSKPFLAAYDIGVDHGPPCLLVHEPTMNPHVAAMADGG